MISNKGLEFKIGKMEPDFKETSKMELKRDLENSIGVMDHHIKVNLKITC